MQERNGKIKIYKLNVKGNTYVVTFLIDELLLNNGIWFQNIFFLEIMTKSEGNLYLTRFEFVILSLRHVVLKHILQCTVHQFGMRCTNRH